VLFKYLKINLAGSQDQSSLLGMRAHTTRHIYLVRFILNIFVLKVLKKDSRKKSFIEALFDITVGFMLYLPVNFFILPIFASGIQEYNLATMLSISTIYTSIALVRKYLIRRAFVNKTITKILQNLTKFIK